jgi:hypothetical protein
MYSRRVVASAASLINRAQGLTNTSDLGRGSWRAGLDELVMAVDAEVDDAEIVERIEAMIVERLVQRSRIEAWYAENADAACHPVESPIVIVGLPRTATTALHHILARHPQLRYLRSWELRDPVPPPVLGTEADDPRRLTQPPRSDVRHIVAVDGPVEDWPIHALAFDHAELTLPVPAYSARWRSRDHVDLFAYHERVLRLLHSSRPPRRWLLKMPAYLFQLEEMASRYPSACFVMSHRDPVKAMGSICSVVADSRRKRFPTWSQDPSFGRFLLDHWAEGMQIAMSARDALGEHRFMDVAQQDLERDAVGVARRICAAAGLTFDEAVRSDMEEWANANRRGARGEHKYSLEEYGLTSAEVTDAFSAYAERFEAVYRGAD